MIKDKTKMEIPVEVPEGEIDWLEMTNPPKEFRTHTMAPRVSYRNVVNLKISNKTETLVP